MRIGPRLENYREKYRHALLTRSDDGVLEVVLHSDGSDLIWGAGPHEELGYLFEDIGRDPHNKVIIMTGAGAAFIGRESLGGGAMTAQAWQRIHADGKRLIMSHLDIEVPMIAAVNGPALVHAELALLCDVVIAAENAVFADSPHFTNGLVPGDGVQVVWPMLLGMNRARYFLLTGQHLDALRALDWGVVNEVLPREALLPRARELAATIAARPAGTLRATRSAMVHQIKKAMHDNLGYGLMLEGMAAIQYWPAE
ncbi:crotonase [Pseudonocardia sulfidoxydans NBRC 16205]|uniref:Crotonase n=1 Tax=Pseudonocardia sulfidoxydans NBRC 16205 TaxID=1223511 RepID=A0A511DNM9_9PSEU|nr:enoyl-CoA hydratase-related protein [Pseudonocardia sulfidoxydans]GEL26405.1 crotonase [Pseudonocardia sulfidoxydans NBRC 16205]